MKKMGFLVVDMQKVFLQDKINDFSVKKACEHINYVADLFRSKDHCVIHIQDIEDAAILADPNLLEFFNKIDVDKTDIHITKESSNAFWNTELEKVLLKQGIDFVVIAGFAVEHCVLFTYNGARERGFQAVILQNGIVSEYEVSILAMYRDRNMISHPAIKFMVG